MVGRKSAESAIELKVKSGCQRELVLLDLDFGAELVFKSQPTPRKNEIRTSSNHRWQIDVFEA